jgi:hypothetical protein
MKRLMFVLSAATVLLLLVSTGSGGPVVRVDPQLPQIPQFASQTYTMEFKGGQRALVIASGDGSTYMGLYVYDSLGNCIAWDDEGNVVTKDDLAVDWYPRQNAVYCIEVCNCGPLVNPCKVFIR